MKPGITVVIITYNGAHRISNVLEALTKQSRLADQVVIVIDGSKDNTGEEVSKFRNRLPLKIVEIANKGRSGARNVGVENSDFELIVYLDDDTRPFTDCLKDHWEHHSIKPGCIFVGHILEDPTLFVTDIQQYRITLYERKGWIRQNQGRVPMKKSEFFLAAANLSVSQETFNKLGGFNEIIRDTEDFDFGSRAMEMGIEIYHIDGVASAYHDELVTCKSFIERQRQYKKSNKQIYDLNPKLYEQYLPVNFFNKVPAHKKAIYFFISGNTIVKMIDAGIMKYLLPKSIRYVLYDYIINGLVNAFPDRKLT